MSPIAPATEVSLKQILDEFEKQYSEYKNETYAAYLFLEIKQKPNERFQDFYSRLHLAVDDCNYGANKDRMLKDKIIQGLQDKPLQERLLRETSKKEKTLQDIISECKAAEQSKAQASAMNEPKIEVSELKRRNEKKSRGQKMSASGGNPVQLQKTTQRESEKPPCRRCDRKHEWGKCPAYGSTCAASQ